MFVYICAFFLGVVFWIFVVGLAIFLISIAIFLWHKFSVFGASHSFGGKVLPVESGGVNCCTLWFVNHKLISQ